MLPALALLVLQGPVVTLGSFVAESNREIMKIKQGLWSLTTPDKAFGSTAALDGKSWKIAIQADGKPVTEFGGNATLFVYVDHKERVYSRVVTPEAEQKADSNSDAPPDPLPPLEKDRFELRLDTQRGLVFRVNPPPPNLHLEVAGDTESIVGGEHHPDGKDSRLELSRDRKTKIPRRLITVSSDGETHTIDFKFERRPPSKAELTIDPQSYQGYREVAPPQNPSR